MPEYLCSRRQEHHLFPCFGCWSRVSQLPDISLCPGKHTQHALYQTNEIRRHPTYKLSNITLLCATYTNIQKYILRSKATAFINGCVFPCIVSRAFHLFPAAHPSIYRDYVLCPLGENSLSPSLRNADNGGLFRIFLCVKTIEIL